MGKLFRFWLIGFLMFPAISVLSQTSSIDIKGILSDQNTGSGQGGVTVSLYRDGVLVETVTTTSNGKYKFKKTTASGIMTVKFSKPGFVGKYAEIDMNGINAEDGGEFPLEVSTGLFENIPGVDFSVLDTQPVAKAAYDKGIDNIVWNEQYIEKKKKEIQKIVDKAEAEKQKQADAQAAQEQKFNDAVAAANAAMGKGDYATAITKYNEALTVKDDADIKTKLKDAEEKKKAAEANAEIDKNYNAQMAEAKKFFDAKDYGSAKSKYEEASKTKPAETAPKDKIKEIDAILKKQLDEETAYNKFLADGEKAMLAENYDEAIKQFTEAGKMRPAEQQPKDELKKAQDAKKKKESDAAAEKKKKEDFDKLVAAGDVSNSAKKYDEAIANYDKALALIDDAAVKTKRDAAKKAKEDADLAKKKEEEEKEKERLRREEFDKLMAKGNGEMAATEYEKAIASFDAALITIPNEPTAVAKLAEAKKKRDEQLAANKNKAKFDEIVARADGELSNSEFDKAIASYKEALVIIKDDPGAKTKLADAESKKAAFLKNKADFDKLVQEGDVAATGKKYDDAIAKYEKALTLNQDAGVQAKIDKAKADRDAADQATAAEKKKKDDFNALLTKGDAEVKAETFDAAISTFEEALKLFPKEATAEAKLADAKAKKKAKEDADLAAKDKAAKQEQFDKLMAQGDGEMSASEFDKAITSYTSALAIFKDDATAKTKLADAQKKKNELATNKANFDKLVQEGDAAISGKKYDDGISKYEKALAIMQDANVQSKLDKAKADRDAAIGAAEAEKKKKQDFDALIVKGDGEVKSESFDAAISSFEEALKIFPKETTAEAKLADAKAKKKAKEDADIAAKDKAAKQEQFDKFIAQGDDEMSSSSYDKAIASYTSALAIFKDDAGAKAKLADAQKKKNDLEMASKNAEEKYKKHYNDGMTHSNSGEFETAITDFEAALVAKPNDPDATKALENAKNKLAERKKELDDIYNQRIAVADKLFDEGKYEDAKAQYVKANSQRPNDEHPKNRIKECDDKIKEKEKNDALAAEKRKNYEAEKAKADEAFKTSKWDESIKHYELALTFLDEQYAKDQISLAKTNRDNALSAAEAEKKKKENFNALIAKGDSEMSAESFDAAISSYQEALTIIPKDPTAEAKLADAKAKKKAKEDADLANKEKAETEAKYKAFMSEGDGELFLENFDKAIASYNNALGVKKDDPTAKAKIAEAQKKKQEAELAAKDKEAKHRELEEKYLKHYNAGMSHSNTGEFETAIADFEAALVIKPGDKDATTALENAKENLRKRKEEIDQLYNQRIAVADKLFDEGKYEDAKAQYVKANTQRPTDEHPKNRIKECDKKISELGEKEKLRAQYNEAMANGEKELTGKHYDKAIGYFEAAKIILPSETLPDERIAEAKRLKELDKEKDALAEKKKRFDALMNEGQEAMNGSEFDKAIAKFEAALEVIPNEKSAVDALALAKQRKKEWEEEKEREIKRILEFADKEFGESNWKEALKYYEKYLKFKKEDPYATSQAEKCRKKIAEGEVVSATAGKYDQLIKAGNKLFGEKKYKDARSKFVDALAIYPTMSYPQKKIDEIDELLQAIADADAKKKREEIANQQKKDKAKGPDYGEKTIMSADEALALLQAAKLDDEKGKYKVIQDKKDQVSIDNQLASKSSEENREVKYDELSEQKKLQKDYSSNTEFQDANKDLFREKQLKLERETKLWNSENEMDEAAKAEVKRQYEERGMNQYEERVRIINSKEISAEKDAIVSNNQTIDKQAAEVRNENGKELVAMKDKLNDKYDENGALLIGKNADEIKKDHELINSTNKLTDEKANTIRENNREVYKNDSETFVRQNKTNQETLLAKNSDEVKNEFLNQHSVNQYINSQADRNRNENSKELNGKKDDFANQNKYNRDEIIAKNSAEVRSDFETQHKTNQELNGLAAEIRNKNADELKNTSDAFADQQKVNQEFLLDQNEKQVKESFVMQSDNARKMDEHSEDVRNENGKDLQDKKDLLSNNTNDASDKLLSENGEEIKDIHNNLNNQNDKMDALASNVRNENGDDLIKKRDDLKTTYDKGAESQADKIRKMKQTQEDMVAAQKKVDQGASKNRWQNSQDLQAKKDTKMVYEKGEEGYKSSYTVDFPQGVTEEVYTRKDADGNVSEVTVRRIVVEGDYGNEYRKVVSKTGTYYFKNGKTITNQTWDMETAKK